VIAAHPSFHQLTVEQIQSNKDLRRNAGFSEATAGFERHARGILFVCFSV